MINAHVEMTSSDDQIHVAPVTEYLPTEIWKKESSCEKEDQKLRKREYEKMNPSTHM